MESLTTLKAPVKRYHESVVMIHHYGGHKFSFKRQIEYLNSIGFDVHTLDLGFYTRWAANITGALDSVAGDKFIYSFSSPSAAALTSMAARGFKDIRGWICDGGPFTHLVTGVTNLIREGGFFGGEFFKQRGWQNTTTARLYSSTLSRMIVPIWSGPNYERRMGNALKATPKDFPIISFRALNDKLVYPQMIDDFFNLGPAQIQPVDLDRCEHLTGFKDQPERYKSFLLDYFKRYGTPIG